MLQSVLSAGLVKERAQKVYISQLNSIAISKETMQFPTPKWCKIQIQINSAISLRLFWINEIDPSQMNSCSKWLTYIWFL